MSKSLVVKHEIRIDAPVERVWEILTKPVYVRQWSYLPEDFGDYDIHNTTVIERPGVSVMKVIEFDVNRTLKYSVYMPDWGDESVTNVGYTYTLSVDDNGHTWLGVEIGDFAIITEGTKYYDENLIFGETASHKIKALAEKKSVVL